jgi:hypothetical protein
MSDYDRLTNALDAYYNERGHFYDGGADEIGIDDNFIDDDAGATTGGDAGATTAGGAGATTGGGKSLTLDEIISFVIDYIKEIKDINNIQ